MSRKNQLTAAQRRNAETGAFVGEGHLHLVTSAGYVLNFRSPAEKTSYQNSNLAQLGRNRGEGDTRGR